MPDHWIHKTTNTFPEVLDNVSPAVKRKAGGFRSTDSLLGTFYFTAAKLRIPDHHKNERSASISQIEPPVVGLTLSQSEVSSQVLNGNRQDGDVRETISGTAESAVRLKENGSPLLWRFGGSG
jgi:hypothetical protein